LGMQKTAPILNAFLKYNRNTVKKTIITAAKKLEEHG
jgi:hypothetical protein